MIEHDDSIPRTLATDAGVGRCQRIDPATLRVDRLVFVQFTSPELDPNTVEIMLPPAAAWDIGRLLQQQARASGYRPMTTEGDTP